MKLTVLGCSGSAAGPDSPASAYLLEDQGYRVLLDLGSGALGSLFVHSRPDLIDAVVLSHLHPDHCADMAGLAVALKYAGYDRRGPIPLVAVEGAMQRLGAIYEPGPTGADLSDVFSWQPPVSADLGPFRVSFASMNHPVPTVAVRAEAVGRSLVYSGDTGQSSALVELAAGADVLLCEASFVDGGPYVPNLHLTGRQAGEHAQAAGVGRLVVTHVPPWCSVPVAVEAARQAFTGPVQPAATGLVVQV